MGGGRIGVVPIVPVLAQTSQQVAWCSGKNNPNPEQNIAACTAVIVAGRYSGRSLALVYNNRANGHLKKDDRDHALAYYDEAIKLDPACAPAYNNRGNLGFLQKEYDAAIADHNHARKLDPAPRIAPDAHCRIATNVYNNRGYAYYTKKDYARAIADHDQAIKLEPRAALIYNNRGRAYSDTKDYDRAIADFSEALRLEPTYAIAFSNRGIAYYAKCDNEHAVADFSAAVGLDPRYAQAFYNRGSVPAKAGCDDRAIADYDAATRSCRNMPSPTVVAARSTRTKATSTAPWPTTTRRIKLNPAYPTALINRGNAWRAKGVNERAVADNSEAVRIDPGNTLAYMNRAIVQEA
jgi:tetratricopeptide (TPR) repeat protein